MIGTEWASGIGRKGWLPSHPFVAVAVSACAIGCGLILGACDLQVPPNQVTKQPVVLTIGIPQTPQSDRRFGIRQVLALMSLEGLTGAGADGRAEPRLAESWTVSPDRLRWHFSIRQGVRFHDGAPVDAISVKRSLDAALADPGTRSGYPGLLDVERIDTAGPKELVITLRSPSMLLVDDLELPITRQAADGASVGTGPFYRSSSAEDEISMQAHKSYYLVTPAIDRIVLKPFPTMRTAWASMMRGEIDFLYEVGQETLEFLSRTTSVDVFSFPKPYVYVIAFNSRRPHLRSSTVRRALNLGVDRSELIHGVLKGRGELASGPLWPQHWAYDREMPPYRFDQGAASAALDEAGLPHASKNDRPDRPPARVRFTCLVPQNFTTSERLALFVQRQLYALNVDMELEVLPLDAVTSRVVSGNFDAALIDVVGGRSLSKPYALWHSPGEFQGFNVFGYVNPDVDRALDGARHAVDDNAYREALARFQRAILNDPPGIFLVWGQTARAVSRRFQVPAGPNRDVLQSLARWRPSGDTSGNTH